MLWSLSALHFKRALYVSLLFLSWSHFLTCLSLLIIINRPCGSSILPSSVSPFSYFLLIISKAFLVFLAFPFSLCVSSFLKFNFIYEFASLTRSPSRLTCSHYHVFCTFMIWVSSNSSLSQSVNSNSQLFVLGLHNFLYGDVFPPESFIFVLSQTKLFMLCFLVHFLFPVHFLLWCMSSFHLFVRNPSSLSFVFPVRYFWRGFFFLIFL